MYLDAAQKSETMKNEQNKAIRLIISTIYFYTEESFWSQKVVFLYGTIQ